jgi:Family of unknown function (DUF6174)
VKTAFHIGILIVLLSGCEDYGSQPREILVPCGRWPANGFQNYTIDQARECYCISSGETMRLVIRSGVIISVTRVSDHAQISPEMSRLYMSVDSLFAKIRNPGPDSIVVTYNSCYGYPERVDINPQDHPRDGGVLYVTSNLQVP